MFQLPSAEAMAEHLALEAMVANSNNLAATEPEVLQPEALVTARDLQMPAVPATRFSTCQ